MKKKTTIAIMLIGGLVVQSFAQSNVFKINFFGAMLQSYTGAFERVLNEKSSLQLSVGYRSYSVELTNTYTNQTYDAWKYSGITIVPEYRMYLTTGSRDIPRGAYAAPFLRYASYTGEYDDGGTGYYNSTTKITSFGGGIMIGYQFLIGDVVAVDIWPGLQYKTRSATTTYANTYDPNDPNFTEEGDKNQKDGIGLRFGVNVGFAF